MVQRDHSLVMWFRAAKTATAGRSSVWRIFATRLCRLWVGPAPRQLSTPSTEPAWWTPRWDPRGCRESSAHPFRPTGTRNERCRTSPATRCKREDLVGGRTPEALSELTSYPHDPVAAAWAPPAPSQATCLRRWADLCSAARETMKKIQIRERSHENTKLHKLRKEKAATLIEFRISARRLYHLEHRRDVFLCSME